MRTLAKLFSVILGLALLAGAAIILWVAHGPQPTEAVTTGGIAYTQEEIAAGTPLSASVDVQGVNTVPVEPAISETAAADLQTLDSAEIAAESEIATTLPPTQPPAGAPPLAPQAAPQIAAAPAVPLTTDVIINENTAVQIAPLASGSATGAAGQGGFASTAAGYEQRVVEVEWPAEFQVGRGGAVRIKLKMLESGALQPVAEIEDNEILATPILITDRYDGYNAFVTSTLSAPDFSVQAVNNLRQPLAKGGEAEWRYTLKANSTQHSVIALGLAISWDPRADNPDPTPGPQNVPIWGQTLEVDVNYVFGLITVPQASIAGTALAVIGFLAEAPILSAVLEHFLGRLFGRRDKREQQQQQRRSRRSRRR